MPGNQNDQVVEINGKLILDTSSSDRSIQQLIQSFKKLEQSPSNKLSADIQKILPVVKQLDNALAKTLGNFSKNDAKNRIKELNSALSDQTKILRDELKTVEELRNKLGSMSELTKRGTPRQAYARTYGQYESAQNKASAAAAGIDAGAQELAHNRNLLNQKRDQTIGGVSRFAELAGMGIDFGLTYEQGKDYRKMLYNAQYAQAGQQIATTSFFDPIRGGAIASHLKESASAASKETNAEFEGKEWRGALTVLAGGLNTLIHGQGEEETLGRITGKMAVGGGTSAVKEFMQNADMWGDLSKNAKKERLGTTLSTAVSASTAPDEFTIALAQNALAKSPARLSVMESLADQKNPSKSLSGLFSTARNKFSYTESEVYPAIQALGHFGLTEDQRSNISPFLAAQRAGLGSAQDLIGQGGVFAGISSNPQGKDTLQEVAKAIEDGAAAGIRKSMGKAFGDAVLQYAKSAPNHVENLDFYKKSLLGMLGGRDLNNVTETQLNEANSAREFMDIYSQGKTPRTAAMNYYQVTGKLSQYGLGIGIQERVSRMRDPSEILGDKDSPTYQSLLRHIGSAQGVETVLNELMPRLTSGRIAEQSIGVGQSLSKFSNPKVRSEFLGKLKKGDKGSVAEYEDLIANIAGAQGWSDYQSEDYIRGQWGIMGDIPGHKKPLKDASKGSQARAFASAAAVTESNQDKGVNQEWGKIALWLKSNSEFQNSILTGKDGLPRNMQDLTEAILLLAAVIEDKIDDNKSSSKLGKNDPLNAAGLEEFLFNVLGKRVHEYEAPKPQSVAPNRTKK